MFSVDGLSFLICSLAVWRATHLLHAEDGPLDVFARMRRIAGDGQIGRLFGCFYCLSMWVAIPFAALLARTWSEGICVWFGLSGAAILLLRATESAAAPRPRWSEPEASSQSEEDPL
jgi:hypothetical protein